MSQAINALWVAIRAAQVGHPFETARSARLNVASKNPPPTLKINSVTDTLRDSAKGVCHRWAFWQGIGPRDQMDGAAPIPPAPMPRRRILEM